MEIIPLFSFFTGVISILSPCILPILPIFIGFSLKSKSKFETLSFILGLFSIFIALIFMTGFATAIVYKYMVYVRIISAIILLMMGMLMLFDYSFGFLSLKPNEGEGLMSSFSLGLLTSLSWAPCYSAYLISLISLLVSSNDPLFASFNIFLYALGFALALLFLSFIISKIDLEKLVRRSLYLPKIFALLIIFGAIYLFYSSSQVFL